MENSSTVESGDGFTFQLHKSKKCIVFVYVYLGKEPHLKSLLK